MFRYLVAVHDKQSHTVQFESAEYFVFRKTPKYPIEDSISTTESAALPLKRARDLRARHLLSETFGTKKARRQIVSLQRNQVNIESLNGASHGIQEAIDKKAEHMLTMKELENSINDSRSIPPFDAQTTDVSKIYKLEDSKSFCRRSLLCSYF
jgi:DNA-directed RNA polymerase I subunit RPA49